jgi:hypothetical protein
VAVTPLTATWAAVIPFTATWAAVIPFTATWAAVAVLAVLASACKPAVREPLVDKFGIQVRGLSWQPAEARKRFQERLFAANAFRPVTESNKSKDSKSWNLALTLDVPEPEQGRTAQEAIAVARLELEGPDDTQQEVVSTAVEKVLGPGLEEWRAATDAAAGAAMQKSVDGAKAVVAAIGKSDDELKKQLESKDAQAKEWAAAVLAERKNPAGLEVLTEMLGSDDLMRARWAMRFLIRLGDARAASPLIEASRHKDDTFQREIVFALGELGGDESEAYLFTVAEGHDLPLMRQSAERALAELRARKSKDGGRP